MRTLTTLVASVAVALLFASPTVAVMHQPSPSPPAGDGAPSYEDVAHVTGHLEFTERGGGGVGTFSALAVEWRHVSIGASLAADDPRLRGSLRLNWNCDVFMPDYVRETSGAIATGTVVVVNEQGSWRGTWQGLTYPKRAGLRYHVMLVGSESYAGLSALLYLAMEEGGGGLTVEGLIFPGEMPPLPDPVATG